MSTKCTAFCKNGKPCRNNAKMLGYCKKHFLISAEDSLDIAVEPVAYDVVQKMPFPTDVSIEILNKAGTKIKIEDRIKYDIPPSKLVINPFFEIKMNKILEEKARPPPPLSLLQQMKQMMEDLLRENEELELLA
jgi:hypothetical protein